MENPAAAATKPVMALKDYLKKYWIAGPIIFLLLIAVGMAIKPWFTKTMTSSSTAAPGDKLPTFLRTFLRISAFVAPFVVATLASDYVMAATQCCADHVQTFAAHGGVFDAIKDWLIGLGGGGVMLGATLGHLSAPDTLDGKTQDGGTALSYAPGAADTKSLFLRTATKNRAQGGRGVGLYAVDTKIAIDTTVEQVAAGTNPIDDQDLARLVDYIEISTPFHGPILSSTTGTGPILNHLINFIGQGFSRAGDSPVETITVPAAPTADTPVTKYFTFPWAQRWLADPSDTTPWLLSLDNMRVDVRVAASTALAAVSTGALTKSASQVRMWTSYNPDPLAKARYLPYWRLDKPASGSDGLSFETFGGAGPTATKKVDKVHTIGWLSNLKGLPGSLTFDTLTRIVAPSFGLDDVRNIDGLVLERLNAQVVGRVGDETYANGGNHAHGTVSTNGGAALSALLFLLLRQPALNMVPGLLMPMDSTKRLNLTVDLSAPRVGADAFLVGSLRELNSDALQKEFTASGGRTPMSYGQPKIWNVQA